MHALGAYNEIRIDNSGMDLNETAKKTISSAVADLSYLLPSVLDSSESAGQLETYMKFNHLLAEKHFCLTIFAICFSLTLYNGSHVPILQI